MHYKRRASQDERRDSYTMGPIQEGSRGGEVKPPREEGQPVQEVPT